MGKQIYLRSSEDSYTIREAYQGAENFLNGDPYLYAEVKAINWPPEDGLSEYDNLVTIIVDAQGITIHGVDISFFLESQLELESAEEGRELFEEQYLEDPIDAEELTEYEGWERFN